MFAKFEIRLFEIRRQNVTSSSISDDEVETSLSDELSASWPASKPKTAAVAAAAAKTGNANKQVVRRSRRKRELRKREGATAASSNLATKDNYGKCPWKIKFCFFYGTYGITIPYFILKKSLMVWFHFILKPMLRSIFMGLVYMNKNKEDVNITHNYIYKLCN